MSDTPILPPPPPPRYSTRQRALGIVAIVVVLGIVAWGAYWLFYARYFESTDDAYVGGDVVAITSREPGTILALHADNTQSVRRGQVLIDLDPANAIIGMQQAEANLAQTVRQTRALFSKADQLRAQIAQAHMQLSQAEQDYRRRQQASGDGAVSQEEVSHAGDATGAGEGRADRHPSRPRTDAVRRFRARRSRPIPTFSRPKRSCAMPPSCSITCSFWRRSTASSRNARCRSANRWRPERR